jgi:hypothetical protein
MSVAGGVAELQIPKEFWDFVARQLPRRSIWLLLVMLVTAWMMVNDVSFLPAAGFAILFFNLDRIRQVLDRRRSRNGAKKTLEETQRQNANANRRHWKRADPQQPELPLEPPVNPTDVEIPRVEKKP